MAVPTTTNNSAPYFYSLMDDKNLTIQTQVVKA